MDLFIFNTILDSQFVYIDMFAKNIYFCSTVFCCLNYKGLFSLMFNLPFYPKYLKKFIFGVFG